MTTAPCTAPIATRIKVQSDLNQQPQWLLIPKAAKSVQDLIKSLVVRLELPESAYDLFLDGAPIFPNEDVALVRDGEHLHLRERQLPSPQSLQLDEPQEPQRLYVSSELDDVRYETHRKRKRVLTPDGKRRRNARNRKREKRRRVERRELPNKSDPSIPSSQPDISAKVTAPSHVVTPCLPSPDSEKALIHPPVFALPFERTEPERKRSEQPNDQAKCVLITSAEGTSAPKPLPCDQLPKLKNDKQKKSPESHGEIAEQPNDQTKRVPVTSAKRTAEPKPLTCDQLPKLKSDKQKKSPEGPGEVDETPNDQTECVLVTSPERTSEPKPLTCDQLPKLKSDEQKKSSESHGEIAVLKEAANKNTALHDEDVLAQNSKHNVDISSTAEAMQPEVSDSGNTRDEEVAVNISFVNEVVDVLNEDTFVANSAVDIENKGVQHGHSPSDHGQMQGQSPDEIERASINQKDKRDTLKSVKPRWKRQRLQGNDSIPGQPDPPSTSVAGAENEEPHIGDASVTNDASHGLETQGNPGYGTDPRRTGDERAETARPPLDVINLIDVEEDCAHVPDRPKGPHHQSVSANSSKSSSPQSIVVSPAKPRSAVLAKGGISTLHALQVARKAGLLAAEKQKDDTTNKLETATEEGGKVRKKSRRSKRSKSSMRYLTEEQINKSTFIGHRPETMLPPLELLDLPEGADELKQAVDVPETRLKTSMRSPPETSSHKKKDADVTSEPRDKTKSTSLVANGVISAVLLNDNRSEARQDKKQPPEEANSCSGLKNNQFETRASEQQHHGMRREIVAQDPPERERNTALNSDSPPLATTDNFEEDLLLMLRHTSRTLAQVWATWDDC